MIAKLKKDLLIGQTELKSLNSFLSHNLDRLTFQKPSEKILSQSFESKESLKLAFENGVKRKKMLKRDIATLKSIESFATLEK